MTTVIAIAFLLGFFALMAVGLLVAKKTLKRGCSLGADCTCKTNPAPASDCEHKT